MKKSECAKYLEREYIKQCRFLGVTPVFSPDVPLVEIAIRLLGINITVNGDDIKMTDRGFDTLAHPIIAFQAAAREMAGMIADYVKNNKSKLTDEDANRAQELDALIRADKGSKKRRK